MMKATLAWLPCTYPQDDGSTRYAAIELTDDRMGSPIILQMPEYLYTLAGGNAVLQKVLSDLVNRVNQAKPDHEPLRLVVHRQAANEY